MTDVTANLGLLMGQSPEEQANEALWAEIGNSVIGAEDGAAATGDALAATPDLPVPDLGAPLDAAAAVHGADAAATLPTDASQAGFPFEASELISLLPHSVASRADEIWSFGTQMAATSNTFLVAIVAIIGAFVLIAAVSTFRVWRREEEFAVSGFGDASLRPGRGYTVRQEPPLTKAGSKPSLREQIAEATAAEAPARGRQVEDSHASAPKTVRRQLKLKNAGEGLLPQTAAPSLNDEAVVAAPAAPADSPPKTVAALRRERRRAARAAEAGSSAAPAAVAQKDSLPGAEKSDKTEKTEMTEMTGRGGVRGRAAFRSRPNGGRVVKTRESEPAAGAAVAATVAGAAPLAASFYGTFGSFHETDRQFAKSYLGQTISAFETAYLTARGPKFGRKLVSKDNVRAERLFMLATQTSTDDPQAALAALWQAVEENPDDAVAWLRLAHFYLESGDTETASQILEPLAKRAEADNLPLVAAAAANSLGRIAVGAGDLASAKDQFGAALRHAESAGRPYMIGVTVSNLGSLEASLGQTEKARDLLLRGVECFDQCDETVASARTKVVLGAVYMALGDQAAANRVWGEAQQTFRAEGLENEAAIVARWLAGDEPPNGVSL